MAYARTGQLERDLGRAEELWDARFLEGVAEDLHAREGSAETGAVLEARRTRAEPLEDEREGIVAELGRRAVAEAGWSPDAPPEARGPTARYRPRHRAGWRGGFGKAPTRSCPNTGG